MFPSYDDWKLATPPEYEEAPIQEEYQDEPALLTHRSASSKQLASSYAYIELDDRNDPPILPT